MLGLESIEMMIRKKRLQWIAHCPRRGESNLTWRRMRRDWKMNRADGRTDEGRMEKVRCGIGEAVVRES